MEMMRFNSTSTARTLVGSDIGSDAGMASPSTTKAPIHLPMGIVQTPDNKQWIDLDYVSPKLLRELRRQYDPQSDEAKTSLAKGAAKIKAWTRQTKLGFDIRLRRKIDSNHDEITDIRLVRDPDHALDQKLTLLPEMPSNDVFELPNNFVSVELPASQSCERITVPEELSAEPLRSDIEEPLPRYERATTTDHRPTLQIETDMEGDERSLHGRSPSGSSIIATPTRGLSVDQERETEREKQRVEHFTESTEQPVSTDSSSVSQNGEAGDAESPVKTDTTEELHALLKALRDQLASQAATPEMAKKEFEYLKVAQKSRYETETDVEPPSPSDNNAYRASLKTFPVGRKKTTRKRTVSHRSPRRNTKELEQESSDTTLLPRRQTLPKKIPPSAGAEAAWAALIRSQAKILGPEHPLCFSARHAQALSRVQQHRNCPPSVLDALRKSEREAMQTLGKVHPLVEAFAADLETLENLIIDVRQLSPSPLLKKRREVVPSNPSKQAAESNTRGSDDIDIDITRDLQVVQQAGGANKLQVEAPILMGESNMNEQQGTNIPSIETSFHGIDESRKSTLGSDSDALWNLAAPPHRPSKVNVAGHILMGVTSGLKRALTWLEQEYGPEPELEPGRVRVRWTCSCGQELYDDFVEKRPGAARELEAYLNRPRPRTRTGGGTPTTPSSTASRSFNGSFNSSLVETSSSQTSWSSYNQDTSSDSNGGTKRSQTTSSLPPYLHFSPLTEPPWLLTCANEERSTPKVAHIDVASHKITSDRDLAKALREHYFDINRTWWKRLKLRGLTTIEFVQFECHQNRFADIRQVGSMPPPGKDYIFEPSELVPPVGSAYLLHLFKHPEDYDGELITYLRAPKRNRRLQLGVGWGINLVEGLLAARVWMLVNATFAFISLVFAIAWVCARNDVQGAFGVAQWICMLAVFVGGWIQACFG